LDLTHTIGNVIYKTINNFTAFQLLKTDIIIGLS